MEKEQRKGKSKSLSQLGPCQVVPKKEVDVPEENVKMKVAIQNSYNGSRTIHKALRSPCVYNVRFIMAKRRVAYRKRNQNRFSMFLVTLVVVMITIVVAVKGVELREKINAVVAQEEELKKQITAEEERALEIEEYAKEVQTKGYKEEVAKDKFGLVHEGEIVFKEED